MASPTPPINRLGGPPPGSSPAGLSAIGRGADPQGGGPLPSGGSGGLTKMFFNVEEQLDAIAQAMPESAEQIDEIKASLRAVMTKAVPTGPGPQSPMKAAGDLKGPSDETKLF